MKEKIQNISLIDYEQLLLSHDWYYMMSDDNSVYEAGRDNLYYLQEIAKQSPEHALLFEKYKYENNDLP